MGKYAVVTDDKMAIYNKLENALDVVNYAKACNIRVQLFIKLGTVNGCYILAYTNIK